jgi:hypothetical protein
MKLKICIFILFLSQILAQATLKEVSNEDNSHLSFLQDSSSRKAAGHADIKLNEDPHYNIDNDEVDPAHPELSKFTITQNEENPDDKSIRFQMTKAIIQHIKNGHHANESSGN